MTVRIIVFQDDHEHTLDIIVSEQAAILEFYRNDDISGIKHDGLNWDISQVYTPVPEKNFEKIWEKGITALRAQRNEEKKALKSELEQKIAEMEKIKERLSEYDKSDTDAQ